ncbi:MAG TPA: hypothetical protein VHU13_08620 [Solirubrobacteraceae bacterium]|nr:hypothetical protein [Solirubrobacteraceae bacterium]
MTTTARDHTTVLRALDAEPQHAGAQQAFGERIGQRSVIRGAGAVRRRRV